FFFYYDLKRAKIYQLQGVLKTLPWVATIDKFQHWLYVNPNHTTAERESAWMSIYDEFSPDIVDKTGLETFSKSLWHRQLHIFEVPFYYIEYGMAQLGAIAIWKRYRENPEEALEDYINALRLGYTKKIGEIYAAAGIEFNFSSDYVKELAQFVQSELDKVLQ
ncbi:MAG: M3 family oligoendopeptidase, partial [Saprospiraceae bacterium]|nr:M3 family oligoendopeptidase [Saprospiraceae bacterium]